MKKHLFAVMESGKASTREQKNGNKFNLRKMVIDSKEERSIK